MLAGTGPALRVCAQGQAGSPGLLQPIAAVPADRIAGPTCFTTDPTPGQLAISALRPCRASVGGGDRIAIEGARFERDVLVLLDGQPIAVESVDPGRIVVVAPPRATGGASDIRVQSPRGPTAEAIQALGWTAVTTNLRLVTSGSDVKLTWDGMWGPSTIERSDTPDFPCGTTAFPTGPLNPLFDPSIGDGRTWYYRAP